MDRRLFLLASLALGGCATLPRAPAGPPMPMAELEPLYGVTPAPDGLRIVAASHGCTAKPDFTFYVDRRAGTVSLAFARRHVDTCGSTGRSEITFGWAELGIDPGDAVFLLNPLRSATGPAATSLGDLKS